MYLACPPLVSGSRQKELARRSAHTLADRGGGGASAIGGAEGHASGNSACAGRGEAGGGDGEAKRHVTRPHDVITCPVVDLARAAEGGNGGAAGHAWLNAALPPPNGRRKRGRLWSRHSRS